MIVPQIRQVEAIGGISYPPARCLRPPESPRGLLFADYAKRIPFLASVSLLYTCMAAPVLYHYQTPSAFVPLTLVGLGGSQQLPAALGRDERQQIPLP